MNWIDINTPPTHSRDVIVTFDYMGIHWEKSYFSDGIWYNAKSEPFTEYKLKLAKNWAEVLLPELKQIA